MQHINSLVLAAIGIGLILAVIKVMPDLLAKAFLRHFDHSHEKKIEELRGLFQASRSSLSASVDLSIAAQARVRSKTVEAIENLWTCLTKYRHAYGGAIAAQSILTLRELSDFFGGERIANEAVHGMLKDYEKLGYFFEKRGMAEKHLNGTEILFVSSRLWLLYRTTIAVHERNGLLLMLSFSEKHYADWRKDKLFLSALREAAKKGAIKIAIPSAQEDLNNVITRLEAEFVKEGGEIIRGSKDFVQSVSEIQAALSETLDRDTAAKKYTARKK